MLRLKSIFLFKQKLKNFRGTYSTSYLPPRDELISEAYSEPSHTSKMKHFAKITAVIR